MMTDDIYQGQERRQFIRLDYLKPLAYKICKKETIDKLLEGYTANVSEAGLLCSIHDKITSGDILWLSFDRDTLVICHDLEKRSVIYQKGIIGKVVRIHLRHDGNYEVGIKFITREEKSAPHTRSAIELLKDIHEGQNHQS